MPFNPLEHLTDLKGKKYLECKWRLCWFRDDHPHGKVSTELLSSDPLLFRASVLTAEGELLATGHGSATAKPGAVWTGREVEKAETAAISRALGHAGYGTQFTEDDELNHLADSPVAQRKPVPQAGTPQQPAPAVPNAPASPTSMSTTATGSGVSGDELPSNVYRIQQVKVVPSGNSHLYLLGATDGTNVALYGGDDFRKLGLDPQPWKDAAGKWVQLRPMLDVEAVLVGAGDQAKWDVKRMAVSK